MNEYDIFDHIDILDYKKEDFLEYLTINYNNNFIKYVYDIDLNLIEMVDCIGTICLIDKDVIEELFMRCQNEKRNRR